MKKNMGGIDKITRIIVALLVVIAVYKGIFSGVLAIVLIVLAFIFVLTSLFSFCPIYTVFGINTCKTKAKS